MGNNGYYLFFLLAIVVVLVLIKLWANGKLFTKRRDLTNQVIIITGANTGIGYETAKDCAKNGAKVILACRDQKRTQPALEQINSIRANSAEFIKLDLSDLSSVRLFAKEFKTKYNRLDALINNAGIMHIQTLELTSEGFESQLGTNYYGHFLLTHLLLDTLKATFKFRVINVSSRGHARGPLVFEDLHYKNRPYNRVGAYAQSKLGNILHSISLQKRFDQENVDGLSVSLHPGAVRTELMRHWTGFILFLKFILYPLLYLLTKSPELGAQTTLYCLHEDFNWIVKGAYYSDCKPKPNTHKQITEEDAEKLWNITMNELKLV